MIIVIAILDKSLSIEHLVDRKMRSIVYELHTARNKPLLRAYLSCQTLRRYTLPGLSSFDISRSLSRPLRPALTTYIFHDVTEAPQR